MDQEVQKSFVLDLRLPNAPAQRIRIKNKMILGQSENADIQLSGHGLPQKALTFKEGMGPLQVIFHADGFLWQGKEIKKGRQIMLDKGDKLTLSEIEIIVREEDMENDDFQEQTNINDFQKLVGKKQDKREKEELSKMSFLQKIKHKLELKKKLKDDAKTKEKKSKSLQKQTVTIPSFKAPNPFYRWGGNLGAFICFYNAYYLWGIEILTEKKYLVLAETWAKKLYELVVPLLQGKIPIPSWENIWVYHDLVLVMLFLIALEILFSLLLSVGPVDFCMGMSTEGGQLSKRLKGFFRAILILPTSPLIITELPALLGKKTLKETLSFSRVVVTATIIHQVLAPLVVVVLIAGGIMLPIIQDISILERPWLSSGDAMNVSKKKIEGEKKLLKLDWLDINILQVIPNDLELLPLLSKEGIDLQIVDVKDQKSIIVKKGETIDWKHWKHLALHGDPLAPFISKNLTTDESDPAFMVMLGEKIYSASALYLPVLHEYLLSHGPFLYPAIEIRKALKTMALTDITVDSSLDNGVRKFILSPLEYTQNDVSFQIFMLKKDATTLQVKFDKNAAGLATFTLNRIINAPPVRDNEKAELHPATVFIDKMGQVRLKGKIEKADIDFLTDYFKKKMELYKKNEEILKIVKSMKNRTINQLEDLATKQKTKKGPEEKLWDALKKL